MAAASRVWVNGALVEPGEARLSPFDHGLLVGDGVFETLRVYRGVPFAWTRHLDRLARSAHGLGLPLPDRDALREAADAVLDANRIAEARLRITVTGGPSPLGSERGDTPPTVIVAATACGAPPESVTAVVVPWTRNERGATAGLKTISYAENVRALAYAREHDADEAVFANTVGNLCEATGSHVFLVADDGVLVTPPGTAGCLLGVTRALTIDLCVQLGIACDERDVPIGALRSTSEAFLTSTTREVQAISALDGRALAHARGETTSRLARAFTDLVERDTDP